ncbi:TIGR04372 family glycosyltransferase [uncultured Pseudodesulfovibrio sp.]|uniref:TIGR04372 family glycosyltransferase n=1 Tax=uncultured Pseudodesulfovibrio sp. TaxID=2035858 RepID=UPI0029C6768B|nr:TIGR04372 family glycosyltransferase [uncultured Pseudodesulfovibrio sp.]
MFKAQRDYRINLRKYRLFYWPLLLPVALLIALFNKISPVPFKIYPIRVERVGQMAANQEEYLCRLDMGLYPKEFRIFVYRDKPSNGVLLDILKQAMPINNLFLPLFDICHKLGGMGVTSMAINDLHGDDESHFTDVTKQHFFLSDEQLKQARKEYQALGLDPDKPFIPILGRDPAYLDSIGEPTFDDNKRNVDINTYVKAIEYMAERFTVLRIGSVVKMPLKCSHPNVFDYSFSGKRSELLDIYFTYKCHFFMSCGTGLDALSSWCFRLPVLLVNFIPPSLTSNLRKNSVVILKKYWLDKENRYLTLSELFENGMGYVYDGATLRENGITVHDNTPEEILEACKEMIARLDGTWVETPEDVEMQEQFWNTYTKYKDVKHSVKVGTVFLRENPYYRS